MRAKAMEGSLLDALKQLTDHDLVEDVRGGVGLLAAVQLRQDLVEPIRRWALASARRPARPGCWCVPWWAARSR